MPSKKVNCWEFMKCGREKNGFAARGLGVCPAYPENGTECYRIAGTLCQGRVRGTFAQKLKDCHLCPFFRSGHLTCEGKAIRQEEPDPNEFETSI